MRTSAGYSLMSGFIQRRPLSGIGAIRESVPENSFPGMASHVTRTGIPVERLLRALSRTTVEATNVSAVGRMIRSRRSHTSTPSLSGSLFSHGRWLLVE